MLSVNQRMVSTSRLQVATLEGGDPEKPVVILLHGNVSSSVFWRDTMEKFIDDYYVLAPDLRGYGRTETMQIDARIGLRDWVEDLQAFVEAEQVQTPFTLTGWSMGGGIAMQYAILHPENLCGLILISPLSPYGFGGTRDSVGTPCWPDFAGSGGGAVNPTFVERIQQRDSGSEDANSPRNVMNQFYFRPPFRVGKEEEDAFVESMLTTRLGEGFYPGGFVPSKNWPGTAPGEDGIANAMSPKYVNLAGMAEVHNLFPILWVRGNEDQIVSDLSMFDLGTLGKLGLVPGWPGDDVFPPQPMVTQTRTVLEKYRTNGGWFEELVVEDAGHSPHIERPDVVWPAMRDFLCNQVGRGLV